MNRFIYYLIFINMVSNIATVVPRVLLANSKNGAVISMGLGLVAGVTLTYIIIRFFGKFPGKGLPELMKTYTPKWLYIPTLFYFSIMWYLAGLTTIITYTFIFHNYITPEMRPVITVLPFLIVLSYGIVMKTKSVLYALEIVLILYLPIALFVFIKSYSSNQLNWDFMKIAVMNAHVYPNYSAFSASIFLFMGIFDIAILNRHFYKKHFIGFKQLIIIGLMGVFVLFTTYFLPIGFEGFDGIDKLLYPWISTTDSVRMRFGIIERLVFMFMLFFVSISFINILIHWHIAAKFLLSIIHLKKLKWENKSLTLHLFALLFSASALIIINKITATELYHYTKYFYNSGSILIVVLFVTIIAVNRGVKE